MTTIQLLASQLKETHQGLLATLEGVTDEQANFQPAGTALSVAAVWAHVVESEDMFLSALNGQPSIESTLSPQQTGLSAPQPTDDWAKAYPQWTKDVRVQVAPLTQFTKTVFQASEDYIASLSPDDLETTKDLGTMGTATIEHIISGFMIGHCYSITGEVSAIKGIQGLKGYPW